MSDVHPYPQDITADPFIIFGGLFSRKIILSELIKLEPKESSLFSELLTLSRQCSSEKLLQEGIEKTLNKYGFSCSKPSGVSNCDRLLGDSFLVEIKLNQNNNDPQFWNGSQEDNAILQTRRYLNESKSRNWAVLTNGQVLRLMHKDHQLNFIDFWICDSVKSGKTKHNALFEKMLIDSKFVDDLLERSKKERKIFTEKFDDGVRDFWTKYKKESREWNISLVESVLSVAFFRYFEDIGIRNINDEQYLKVSLLEKPSNEQLLSKLKKLANSQEKFGESGSNVSQLISEDLLTRIANVVSQKDIFHDFTNLFWTDNSVVDLSDLGIHFFGDAYQLFANKNDLNGADGQYFTGSDLARETALYFIEDETRNVSVGEDEVIYDPFVGSGQLLRALIPFYHLLLQGQLRDPSIISGMRTLALRLRGTDIDKNACWLARMSLAIVTAEQNKPILTFDEQIKCVDVFDKCFGSTPTNWQSSIDISGKIRAVITNPPWKQLEIQEKQLFSSENNCSLPTEKNSLLWRKYRKWSKSGGRERVNILRKKIELIRDKHKETFHRATGSKVNVALSAVDFIDRLPGSRNKKWVCFLPDAFFIGTNEIRKAVNVRRYYSFVSNDHFKGADKVMKFGVAFGGGSSSQKVFCHPLGLTLKFDVSEVFSRLGILPIYGSLDEALVQSFWFKYSKRTNSWYDGEFNRSSQKNIGASQSKKGKPVRGTKSSINKISKRCDFSSSSISYWTDVKIDQLDKYRVIVRDSRPNSTKQKILWAGIHKPGKDGVPAGCLIEDSWNYFYSTQKSSEAICRILNSPIADIAVRSVASKRHVSAHHLNVLGLPELNDSQIEIINSASTYSQQVAVIFLVVFQMSKPDAEKVLSLCPWLVKEEKLDILNQMSLDVEQQAGKLFKTVVKKKRNQLKKIAR